MTDIARLQKVIDYTLSLPELDNGIPDLTADRFWMQGNWCYAVSGDGHLVSGPVTITEQGTVNEQGHPCKTAMCVAGNAIAMFGAAGTTFGPAGNVTMADGSVRRTAAYAAELLDIEMHQAVRLFDGSNGPITILDLAGQIIADAERAA